MNNLTLNLNKEPLLELMKNFNLLTGLKIALFDTSGSEILSFPEEHCPFCRTVRSYAAGNSACLDSNERAFIRCQKSKALEIYTCHAGLIEVAAPLLDNGAVIGYIMFGQITDNENKSEVKEMLYKALEKYRDDAHGVNAGIYTATFKSDDQILAAAKILEACTLFVLFKDMVSLQRETFIGNLNRFLLSHLDEDLSIDRLVSEFNISKNKLYESCSKYLSVGIAEHIKILRINEAKRLLKDTELTVMEVSGRVGFNDYNYFCRVFKQVVGIPAKKYRTTSRIA